MDKENQNLMDRIIVNDTEIRQIQVELEANESDRNELHKQCDYLESKIDR